MVLPPEKLNILDIQQAVILIIFSELITHEVALTLSREAFCSTCQCGHYFSLTERAKDSLTPTMNEKRDGATARQSSSASPSVAPQSASYQIPPQTGESVCDIQ